MKLKKSIYNKFNFITYSLVNLKLKNKKNLSDKDFKINFYKSLDVKLKKTFKIIYEFHRFNQNIVFIGFPESRIFNFNSLFFKFNYLFLKNKVWVNGVLCNSKALMPYIYSKRFKNFFLKEKIIFLKNFSQLVKLKKSPDLLVLFDITDNGKLLSEANKLKIPVISFINNINNSENLVITSNVFSFNVKYSLQIILKMIYMLFSSIMFRGLKKHIK